MAYPLLSYADDFFTFQNGWLKIEFDGGNLLLAELQLRVDDLAHGISNDEVNGALFG
jgi:hypothetical protein